VSDHARWERYTKCLANAHYQSGARHLPVLALQHDVESEHCPRDSRPDRCRQCWRVLDAISEADLAGNAAARAAAREIAWPRRAEVNGQALPASLVAGQPLLEVMVGRCW
jgi:hypothetical protein